MKPHFGQSDAAMNKLAGCNKFENGAGSISNQKVLDGLQTIASLELQARNEGFETPYEMLTAKRIKRISPISYENGYEDGFEKGRMSMQPAKNMTEHMTPEPLPNGYYGHHNGCDCAVCEDIHMSELAKQRVDAEWNKLLDDNAMLVQQVAEITERMGRDVQFWKDETRRAIEAGDLSYVKSMRSFKVLNDVVDKYRAALHIIAHMGISGLSWQHDYEKCVNIAKEALEI
jgi:hypothetical protein